MNVFFTSKPHAIMSLMFSSACFFTSSIFNPRHKNFSSSVNWMTKGTSNVSCSHLVKINGIKWPTCSDADDGPRPVYKKNFSPFSILFNIGSKSRWEKNIPRRRKWCNFVPAGSADSNLFNRSSVTLAEPKRAYFVIKIMKSWIKKTEKNKTNQWVYHNRVQID